MNGREYAYKASDKEDKGRDEVYRDSRKGKGRYDCISPYALKRLARVFEHGMTKHHNKDSLAFSVGFKFTQYLDSALRHLLQFEMGMEDEDHLAHAAANIMAMMHQQDVGLDQENDDLPLRRYLRDENALEVIDVRSKDQE